MAAQGEETYSYVDMHIHVLPGVDDGSKDMNMSLAMLRVAAENRIGTMILTPHNKLYLHSVSPESQMRRMAELQEASDEAGLDIQFYPGNELMYDYTLPQRLNEGKAMTLASSDYCLVEFDPGEQFSYILEGLRSLTNEGYRPVLAHCERYLCLTQEPSKVDELMGNGVLMQVNAADVTPPVHGMGTRRMFHFVNELLAEEKIRFVSTDAHRPSGRAPELNEAAAWLNRRYGREYTRELLHDNAMKIIRNEPIDN